MKDMIEEFRAWRKKRYDVHSTFKGRSINLGEVRDFTEDMIQETKRVCIKDVLDIIDKYRISSNVVIHGKFLSKECAIKQEILELLK